MHRRFSYSLSSHTDTSQRTVNNLSSIGDLALHHHSLPDAYKMASTVRAAGEAGCTVCCCPIVVNRSVQVQMAWDSNAPMACQCSPLCSHQRLYLPPPFPQPHSLRPSR